jgi:hypothetical protein
MVQPTNSKAATAIQNAIQSQLSGQRMKDDFDRRSDRPVPAFTVEIGGWRSVVRVAAGRRKRQLMIDTL